MNLDVVDQGFKIQNAYWENQWLIGVLHEQHDIIEEFLERVTYLGEDMIKDLERISQ